MSKRGRGTFIAAFLAPAVLLYAVFVCYPVVDAFRDSLYRWRGVSANRTFVGMENFKRLAGDKIFWTASLHNLFLLFFGGLFILTVAIGIAHLLQKETKLVSYARGIFLLPQMVSLVVVAVLWEFIYDPAFGLLNFMKHGSGGAGNAILADSHTALPGVGIAFVWHALGFYIMLYAAGLRSIPQEVNEAAMLDGAQGFLRVRKVTMPMLWSISRVAVVYLVINSLNVFALVFLMTQGGPDRKTEVMLTYLYEQAFTNYEFGYATALAVANFALVMALSLVVMLVFRRDPQERRA
jgi:N-acetylglucosamine transport system permease protein